MELTAENITACILAARTLTNEQKEAMMEMFKNPAITNEELSTKLQALADAEIKLREEENANLEAMAAENAKELAAEEAIVQPQIDTLNDAANEEAGQVVREYAQKADALDADLSKICETIKRTEHESDQMDAIRAQLGITQK